MCGRFALTLPNDALAQLFAASPANTLPALPNYNICPTNPVACVLPAPGGRRIGPMRWGFVPQWYARPNAGPLLINARAETIATKPAFAAAVRKRRCLIPAAGFYEWEKAETGARLPWYVTRADGQPMVFAGLWQNWVDDTGRHASCAIVTTAAGDDIADIHHRQPLILGADDWALWLGEAGHGAARLMQPSPPGCLRRWRVGPEVNSNQASGAGLCQPLASADQS